MKNWLVMCQAVEVERIKRMTRTVGQSVIDDGPIVDGGSTVEVGVVVEKKGGVMMFMP